MMAGLFDDRWDTIKDGPVEIRFERSGEKVKATFIVDFNKSDVSPDKAGTIMRAMVENLRIGLGVKISKFK